jgi:general secretion pathway protein G
MAYSMRSEQRTHLLKEGFTFLELIVVVLILGILLGLVGPNAFRYYRQSQENSTRTQLNSIKTAIDLYKAEIGSYPKQLEDLIRPPSGAAGKKWKEKFLEKDRIPTDAWGNEFVYRITSGGDKPYELYSYGSGGPEAPTEEHISVWEL